MRRLNVKLLVALVVTSFAALVGIYLLHNYQVSRNAEVFKQVAVEQRDKGNLEEAVKNYNRYLRYRNDDVDANCDFAMLFADMIEQQAGRANAEQARRVPYVLEQALRTAPDRDDIRRRLARFNLEGGRTRDALEHFNLLLKKHPNDAELKMLVGMCHEQDKNYDKAREMYEAAKADAPNNVQIYALLASLMSGAFEDPQTGDQYMDEVVEKNPDNHLAYLMRYNYRVQNLFGDRIDAKTDLQKALDLAPNEADVIVKMAELLIHDREFDSAREHLNRGIELHPKNESMYITLARLELELARVEEKDRGEDAQEALLQGLKKMPESITLLSQMCELQIRRSQFDKANDTIARLVQLDMSQEQVDFLKSRVLIGEKKWADAGRLLHSLRQRSSRDKVVLFQIDALLADCYGNLGQSDLAIVAMRRALENNPYAKEVRLRLVHELQRLGKLEEANAELQKISAAGTTADYESVRIKIAEQLQVPVDQRKWEEVDELMARLTEQSSGGAELALFKVRLLVYKGKTEEALELAIAEREKFPQSIGLWIAVADIQGLTDNAAAIATLKEAADRFHTPLLVQLAMVSKVLRLPREEALAELQTINQTVDSYKTDEQRQLAQSLGEAFYLLKESEAAKEVLNRVAGRLPSDPLLRLMMFNLARDSRDEQGMTDALAGVEAVVGKDHNYWQYCAAARLATLYMMQKATDKDLTEARRLVDKVVESRPNWTAIIRLSAEVDDLSGRSNDAITKYQEALRLGETSIGMVRRLVELLYKTGRYNEANQALAKLPTEIQFTDDFGKLQTELQMKLGLADDAAKRAEAVVDEDSTEFGDHLWQGQLFARAGRRDDAEAAYRRAVKHGPQEPLCWIALVTQLVQNGKRDEAQATLTEVEASVPADKLAATMGQCNEVLGNVEQAGQHYATAVETHGDDTAVLRSAIEFHVRAQQMDKAQQLLEKLVALAPQKKEAADLDRVRWGRRTLAALIATSNSYADLRRALQILDGNADANRNLPQEDVMIKANLLAARDDLRSRREGIQLLEAVLDKEPTRNDVRLQLAQLHERDNNWLLCRDHMLRLLGGDKPSPIYVPIFANMLLRQNQIDDAARMLEKLEQIDPNAPITLAVKALLYARRGYFDEAIGFTRELVVRPLAPSQAKQLYDAAQQFERLSNAIDNPEGKAAFINAAEEMYEEYVRERPEDIFLMAAFQGKYRGIEPGLKICEENFHAQNSPNIAAMAMGILREHRSKANQDQIARVEKLLVEAAKQHPEAVGLGRELAELRELQGNYVEATRLYQQILDNPQAPAIQKAAAANNLSYLLALHKNDGNAALPLAEQAIAYFGPTAELLDTRGVAHLARKDYELAIRDLSEAVEDRPNGLKYFHLAWAHHLAGDDVAAKKALDQGDASGLKDEEVSALERDRLTKLRHDVKVQQQAAR
ncbi:MAG: tetratricopeptide repeat protein [Pirellulales bacterium]|nr:tetratricopeptide repeat protein [Pirellulales bacterium]